MWLNKELVALICGLRQLQKYGYPYEVDEKLTDEEIDTLCENINFETAIPEESYEKFECADCGCSYRVPDRNDFECPNCHDVEEGAL